MEEPDLKPQKRAVAGLKLVFLSLKHEREPHTENSEKVVLLVLLWDF